MKNKQLFLILLTTAVLSLTACAGQSTTNNGDQPTNEVVASTNNSDSSQSADQPEAATENNNNTTTQTLNGTPAIVSEDVILEVLNPEAYDYIYMEPITNGEGDMDMISYDLVYALSLTDDSNAYLRECYFYSDTNYNIYTHIGTYQNEATGIVFMYKDSNNSPDYASYLFEMEGDTVTQVSFSYIESSLQKYAGTYTCDNTEIGAVSLYISEIGKPSITIESGKTYPGNIVVVDGEYDLMVYLEEEDTSIDWYITFGDGTFTYRPYNYVDYSKYAGHYVANGAMGIIEFDVDTEGKVSTALEFSGVTLILQGSIYIDYDTDTLSGMYLSDDEGYSIDVQLMDLGGADGLNYSGYFTIPLAAG